MYFLLGFTLSLSGVLRRYLMDTSGFTTALTLLSVTHIVGISILSFVKDERQVARRWRAHRKLPRQLGEGETCCFVMWYCSKTLTLVLKQSTKQSRAKTADAARCR